MDLRQRGLHRRTVRVVLARDLEHGRKGLRISVHQRADLVRDMLVDQYNCNVLALPRKVEKRLLNVSCCCLVIDDQKVLVAVLIHIANAREDEAGCRVLL